MIKQRESEASKSILVQTHSDKSFNELAKYCSQFGKIQSAHHFSVLEDENHFILVEFSEKEEAKAALDSSVFNPDARGIPARSQFLWFRTGPKKGPKLAEENCRLNVVNGHMAVGSNELSEWLKAAESVNDQILILQKALELTDLGTRLRFLAAQQLQSSISGKNQNVYYYNFFLREYIT